MRFKPITRPRPAIRRARAAFTLVEVLAALLFMAIVIPVAVDGLRLANLAGQVGQRKAAAARIAERIWTAGGELEPSTLRIEGRTLSVSPPS